MPNSTQCFGEALNKVMRSHSCSVSALAQRMNLKSKTTLVRILNGQCLYESCARFFEQLTSQQILPLSNEELHSLKEALQVSRTGPQIYQANCAIRNLLFQNPSLGNPIRIEGLAEVDSYDQFIDLVLRFRKVDALLFSLCDRRIIRGLMRLAHTLGSERFSIYHCWKTDPRAVRSISNMEAVIPILFSPCYSAYTAEEGASNSVWPFNSEMMLFKCEREDGSLSWFHLVRMNQDLLACIFSARQADYELWFRLAQMNAGLLSPVKTNFQRLDNADSLRSYIDYTENYLELENNRHIYALRQDIPINFISPDILYPIVLSCFPASFSSPKLDACVSELKHIHQLRYDNVFRKKKVTHSIWNQEAMLCFASTGQQSDHFFAIRPYTPEERIKILTHVMEENQNNPYFNIYFSNGNEIIRSADLIYFEGAGLLLANAYTSYNLAEAHSETLITDAAFSEYFRTFFMTELLPNHVLPASQTNAFFQKLIDTAVSCQ